MTDIRNLFRQLWVTPFVLVFWGWIGMCMWAAWYPENWFHTLWRRRSLTIAGEAFLLLALIFYLSSWKGTAQAVRLRFWNAFRAGTGQVVMFLVLPVVSAYVVLIRLADWPGGWLIDIARLGLVLLLLQSVACAWACLSIKLTRRGSTFVSAFAIGVLFVVASGLVPSTINWYRRGFHFRFSRRFVEGLLPLTERFIDELLPIAVLSWLVAMLAWRLKKKWACLILTVGYGVVAALLILFMPVAPWNARRLSGWMHHPLHTIRTNAAPVTAIDEAPIRGTRIGGGSHGNRQYGVFLFTNVMVKLPNPGMRVFSLWHSAKITFQNDQEPVTRTFPVAISSSFGNSRFRGPLRPGEAVLPQFTVEIWDDSLGADNEYLAWLDGELFLQDPEEIGMMRWQDAAQSVRRGWRITAHEPYHSKSENRVTLVKPLRVECWQPRAWLRPPGRPPTWLERHDLEVEFVPSPPAESFLRYRPYGGNDGSRSGIFVETQFYNELFFRLATTTEGRRLSMTDLDNLMLERGNRIAAWEKSAQLHIHAVRRIRFPIRLRVAVSSKRNVR